MHPGRAVFDDNYFNLEVYWNNIKKVSVNSGTEYALGVAVVDSSGNLVNPAGNFASTGTASTVNQNAASVTILAANTSRKGAVIHNNSSAILYISFWATATAASFTFRLNPFETYEMTGPIYIGIIDGIWAGAGAGTAVISELT